MSFSLRAFSPFCLSAVLVMAGVLGSTHADSSEDRQKLDEIADQFDAALVPPYDCSMRRERTVKGQEEVAEVHFLGDRFIVRSGDVIRDGARRSVRWRSVRFRNERYFASLARSEEVDKWQVRSFISQEDPKFERVYLDVWQAEHPSGRYLYLPPLTAAEYLRKSKIVSRSSMTKAGKSVDVWALSYTPIGREKSFPTRDVIITSLPPYRLLGFRQDSYEMSFGGFETTGEKSYPTRVEYADMNARSGDTRTEFIVDVTVRELDDEFDRNALYLSHYGLPEPEEGGGRVWVIVIAVLAALIGIAGYRMRQYA